MYDVPNDYGPWLEPQPKAGFCVFCKKEKTPSEIRHYVDDDSIFMIEEVLNIDQSIKLPLVFCKNCVDDDWFVAWDDFENHF